MAIMLEWLNKNVFGFLVPLLLLIAGVYFFILLKGFPVLHPRRCLRLFFLKEKTRSKDAPSAFSALCMALAGTLGIGNIAGVALAIMFGGAGSIFWMWVSGLFAMMIKYAEVVLAMNYRIKGKRSMLGGAMYYIKNALGHPKIACFFGFLCLICAFTMGNFVQANAVAECLQGVLHIPPFVTAVGLFLLTALVIFGGAKKIANLTSKLIPLLTLCYIVFSVIIIVRFGALIPTVFSRILQDSFSPFAVGGGIGAFIFARSMRFGVARGLMSNEAGCGTAPMAHATAETEIPAKQGLFGIFEVFLDTIVLCTLTAFVLLLSFDSMPEHLGAVTLVVEAFAKTFGNFAYVFVPLSIFFFAWATILCWGYYGESCVAYFTSSQKTRLIYLVCFCLCLLPGCFFSTNFVWSMTDCCLSLMTTLHVFFLLRLSGEVYRETKRAGLLDPAKQKI